MKCVRTKWKEILYFHNFIIQATARIKYKLQNKQNKVTATKKRDDDLTFLWVQKNYKFNTGNNYRA